MAKNKNDQQQPQGGRGISISGGRGRVGGSVTRSRSGVFLHRTRSGRIRRPALLYYSIPNNNNPSHSNHPKVSDEAPPRFSHKENTNDDGCMMVKHLRTHRVFSTAPPSSTAVSAAAGNGCFTILHHKDQHIEHVEEHRVEKGEMDYHIQEKKMTTTIKPLNEIIAGGVADGDCDGHVLDDDDVEMSPPSHYDDKVDDLSTFLHLEKKCQSQNHIHSHLNNTDADPMAIKSSNSNNDKDHRDEEDGQHANIVLKEENPNGTRQSDSSLEVIHLNQHMHGTSLGIAPLDQHLQATPPSPSHPLQTDVNHQRLLGRKLPTHHDDDDQVHIAPVLASCSRLKVFSNPTLHCYRRLLPFLVDLTKNNSGKLEIIPTRNQTSRVENDATRRPLSMLPASLPQGNTCASPRHKGSSPLECTQIEDAIFNISNKNQHKLPLDSAEYPKDGFKHEFDLLSKPHPFTFSTHREDLTVEELVGSITVSGSQHLPGWEKDCSRIETCPKEEKHHPRSCHMGDLSQPRINVSVPLKGILKRPRGGCKGPCTCLNCTSFQLHAERAFEFSKKQMHEAQDVILGLMKEISDLKKLVANSIIPLVGKEGYAILPFDQVQVEDFCKRASEAERAARTRLREMTCDLHVHCRITRQIQHNVTFADHGKDGEAQLMKPR